MRILRTLVLILVLTTLMWLASGLRWPGFSDPDGDWFRLVSQLSATLLGGTIAASVTWYFASRKLAEERRSSLTRLFLKLVKIAGGLRNTVRTIDEMLAAANKSGHSDLPMWARVLPISGLPPVEDIDVSDLAPLLEFGESAIVNEIILLDQRNRSMLSALETYNNLRLELRDRMPVTTQSGPVSTTELTVDQLAALSPRFSELDSLIKSSLASLRTDVDSARSILDRFPISARKVTKRPFPTVRHVD